MFCFSDGFMRVMKPREIFSISIRTYYPSEENGVCKKYPKLCCLLFERGKPSSLRVTSIPKSPTGRSVLRISINKAGINEQLTNNRSVSPLVPCLIALLWYITFSVQLMWHQSVHKTTMWTSRWFTVTKKNERLCLHTCTHWLAMEFIKEHK